MMIIVLSHLLQHIVKCNPFPIVYLYTSEEEGMETLNKLLINLITGDTNIHVYTI